jgi:hypothetical protein
MEGEMEILYALVKTPSPSLRVEPQQMFEIQIALMRGERNDVLLRRACHLKAQPP